MPTQHDSNSVITLQVSKRVVNKLYPLCAKEMQLVIQREDPDTFSLAADCLTARNKMGYYGIAASYITKGWDLRHLRLPPVEIDDMKAKTSELLGLELKAACRFIGLLKQDDMDKPKPIFSLTTDNGSADPGVADANSVHPGRCVGHTLELSFGDIANVDDFKVLLTKLRRIVTHQHHSKPFRIKFKQCQVQVANSISHKTKLLKQESPTRWCATVDMMSSFLELQLALLKVGEDDQDFKQKLPTRQEWQSMKSITGVLSKVKEVLVFCSGHKYPTISVMLPMIYSLLVNVQSDLDEEKKKSTETQDALYILVLDRLRKSLHDRFFGSSRGRNGIPIGWLRACVVDPRFQTMHWFPEASRETILQGTVAGLVTELCSLHEKKSAASQPAPPQPSSDVRRPVVPAEGNKGKKFLWLGGLQKPPKRQRPNANPDLSYEQVVQAEFKAFLQEDYPVWKPGRSPQDGAKDAEFSDPLEWWKSNESKYPNIAIAARRYLAILASSVPVERLFSSTGIVISPKRTSINSAAMAALVFINGNWPFFKDILRNPI